MHGSLTAFSTQPVNDNATVTSYIIERARKFAVTNVFPIGAITKNSGWRC